MIERRYQMTRVRKGIYLLPSNDGQTLWRISSYDEDGNAEWVDANNKPHTLRGTFWMAAKHRKPMSEIAPHLIGESEIDWIYSDDWLLWHTCLRTREAAIQAALETSERDAAAA